MSLGHHCDGMKVSGIYHRHLNGVQFSHQDNYCSIPNVAGGSKTFFTKAVKAVSFNGGIGD